MNIELEMPELSDGLLPVLTETAPYLTKETPSGVDRLSLKLVGGTVALNQMVRDGDFTDETHTWRPENIYASLSVADGVATVTLTSSAWNAYTPALSLWRQTPKQADDCYAGHKYIIAISIKSSVGGIVYFGSSRFSRMPTISTPVGEWVDAVRVVNCTRDDDLLFGYIGIGNVTGAIGDSFQVKRVAQYDLTQMFGSTIADYVYSLEQATVGSGIAWLKSYGFFTEDYYPYNAGELLSVKTSAHKTVGKNLLEVMPFATKTQNGVTITYNDDGSVTLNGTSTGRVYQYLRGYTAEWFPIGATYTFRLAGLPNTAESTFLNFSYSDNGTTYAGSYGQITGNGTKTITATHEFNSVLLDIPADQSFNNNKIFVNAELGTTVSDWVPYYTATTQLSDIDLRGVPKLVNNELQYDGDTYASDGTVTRRYGIVDLGTLTWTWNNANGWIASVSGIGNIKPMVSNAVPMNGICDKYRIVSKSESASLVSGSATELAIAVTWQGTYLYCTNQNVSPSGWLVYEKPAETTETATPYTDPMTVGATESFVDSRTVPMPVGNVSEYKNTVKMQMIQLFMP